MKFSKYNIIHTTENQEHILFNSLWGSTFVISPSVKQAIESSNPTLLTEEENRLFIKYNALIPDEYNESCIYNHFYNKSRYGKKCLTATVLLTWSCNFRCIYCYEGAGELRCENMTKNRAGAIANFLIKCSEEQRGELIHVVLFGGEPLLNIDVGFHMLGILKEYCLTSHKELQCSLVTNGSLLTEEIVSGLLNYNCKFVQITLDGPEYIHNCRRVAKDGSGTFQKVLHAPSADTSLRDVFEDLYAFLLDDLAVIVRKFKQIPVPGGRNGVPAIGRQVLFRDLPAFQRLTSYLVVGGKADSCTVFPEMQIAFIVDKVNRFFYLLHQHPPSNSSENLLRPSASQDSSTVAL